MKKTEISSSKREFRRSLRLPSPIGELYLAADEDFLYELRFGAPELAMSKNAAFDMAIEAEDIVIEDTVTVVREIK